MPDQNTLLLIYFVAFVPHASNWLGVITPLEITAIKGLGWLCLLVSLLWMLIAQAQMGAQCRYVGCSRG